jgi:hypothetical protein
MLKLITATVIGAASAAQWKLLVKHDATSNEYFPRNTLTYKSPSGKLMMDLDQDYAKFRAAGDGRMKLKLVYPEFATNKKDFPLGKGKKNLVWKQSSSPLDSKVTDYKIAFDKQHDFDGNDDFKGLCRSTSSGTLLDGQPEHGNWFYAVGAHGSWGGRNHFPGPRGSQNVAYGNQAAVSQMELWVMIPANVLKTQAPTPAPTYRDAPWTLLVKHDATSKQYFPRNTLTYKSNDGKLIMDLAQDYNQFRGTDGKLVLKLVYPEFANRASGNGITDLVWKQSTSPLDTKVQGYSIAPNAQHDFDGGDDFKGLCRSTSSSTLLDGQPEHGNWFYAVGAHNQWNGAGHFPGPRGSQKIAYGNDAVVSYVELWVQQVKTDAPTKSPTTKTPTSHPTVSPTERCNANNCMNWSCVDWCECFDKADEPTYQSYAGCQDDNDDTCICFENDEHDLNGERHRKINYNQDAVDAGTATMIEGTEIHTATKQNHYQEATESPTKSPTSHPTTAAPTGHAAIKELVLSNGNTLKRFSNKHLDLTGGHARAHRTQANFCAMQGGRLPTYADICPSGEYGQPAMGCVAAFDHSWVPYSKNANSYAFISCGGHNGMVCKDHVKHHGNPNWGSKGDVYGSQVECIIPLR